MKPAHPTPSPPHDAAGRAAVLGLGGLVVACALVLSWIVPYTPGRLEKTSATLLDRLPHWAFLLEHRPAFLAEPAAVAALLIVTGGLAFGALALGLRLTWNRASRRDLWIAVLVAGLLASALNVLSPPNLNSNIFNYISRGRVGGAHGENPYEVPAGAFADDPLLPFANPDYIHTPGGKLAGWMVVNVTLARIAGDDPVVVLLVYRSALFLANAACLLLLALAARRVVPDRALAAAALWAWNPIVIMNGQSRTDTFMVLYLAAGMLLLAAGRRAIAAAPLALSVFVKIVTLPLLAVAALAEMRAGRWRRLGLATLAAIAATVAVWSPFVDGNNADEILASYTGIVTRTDGAVGSGTLRTALRAGFAVLVLAVGLTRRRDDLRHLLGGWAIVQLYFSVFLAKFASADYLMTLLAIVAVVMEWRIVALTFALALSYFMFDTWYLVGSETFRLPDLVPFSPRLVFLLPPVAAALAAAIWARRRLRGVPVA